MPANEVIIQIVGTALVACNTIGMILVFCGKLSQQALMFIVPYLFIGIALLLLLYRRRKER